MPDKDTPKGVLPIMEITTPRELSRNFGLRLWQALALNNIINLSFAERLELTNTLPPRTTQVAAIDKTHPSDQMSMFWKSGPPVFRLRWRSGSP